MHPGSLVNMCSFCSSLFRRDSNSNIIPSMDQNAVKLTCTSGSKFLFDTSNSTTGRWLYATAQWIGRRPSSSSRRASLGFAFWKAVKVSNLYYNIVFHSRASCDEYSDISVYMNEDDPMRGSKLALRYSHWGGTQPLELKDGRLER